MTEQPHTPENLAALAAHSPGGPEEAGLGAEQRAEVEEQRAVRRALSSLSDPEMTPEERRSLRRAVHRAHTAETTAATPRARRRLRPAWAWPALAAVAALAVATAAVLNLGGGGDDQREDTFAAFGPATTAAAITAAPAATHMATTTTFAPAITEAMAEDNMDAAPLAEPETDTAAEQAAATTTMAAMAEEPSDQQAAESARSFTFDAEGFPVLWGPDDGIWHLGGPQEHWETGPIYLWSEEWGVGPTERLLTERTRSLAAQQPDVFPMPYSELGEYADRTGLACWNDFTREPDEGLAPRSPERNYLDLWKDFVGEAEEGQVAVVWAGRAWIAIGYLYEVYHLEREREEPPYDFLIFYSPPDEGEPCWPFQVTAYLGT